MYHRGGSLFLNCFTTFRGRSRKLSKLFCVMTVFILVDSKKYFLVRLCIVPGSEEEECTCIGKNRLYVQSIPCNVNTFHYFSPLNQFAKLAPLSLTVQLGGQKVKKQVLGL